MKLHQQNFSASLSLSLSLSLSRSLYIATCASIDAVLTSFCVGSQVCYMWEHSDAAHGSFHELFEQRSAETSGRVPASGAVPAVRELLATAADLVGALDNIEERVRVLVEERVEETHGRLSGGEARVLSHWSSPE